MNDSLSELAPILQAFGARTGITPAAARLGAHDALVAKLLAQVRCSGSDRVMAEISSNSALFDELTDELTIPETYFFRDAAQFDLIRTRMLPDIQSRCGFEHPIHCWSAASSTGEELYSVAILLFEAGLADRAFLVGTDISPAALAWARAGKYRNWSLRGEGAAAAEPYLRNEGEWKVINDTIRRRLTFMRLNLAQDCYPAPSMGISDMDLILCRNVLIYFDGQTIGQVALRLFNSLAPGGWLLTAAADPILAEYAPFDVIVTTAGLVYRRPACLPPSVRATQLEVPNEVEIHVPRLEPATIEVPVRDRLCEARKAFTSNDYATAAALTRNNLEDPEACLLHIRSIANLGDPSAEPLAEQAIERHPFSPELYYLLAHIRLLRSDDRQAILLLRKALYLDPSLIMAHFVLGSLLQRSGDWPGAGRCFGNAIRLAEALPPEATVPMSDDQTAGEFAAAARKSLQTMTAKLK